MASNNIILAVPSANSSVNYELPQSESAQLSFSPEDIDGIKLDDNGGLVISFVEGGQVTLSNFQSFIDNGNALSLADGTQVDPKLLFTALGGEPSTHIAGTEDIIRIGVPAENAQMEYDLEQGEKYLFNFDLSETQGANVKDGKMVIDFANGGKIVINNYETAMASKDAPELSLAAKTCIVSGDELITNIQNLAKTEVAEVVVEEVETAAPKSKIADADLNGREDIGANTGTKLGYKAPEIEPTAEDLANIETAAGGAAAGAGRAGGYGYQSRFSPDPFQTNPDIGPINPTQLRYKAPLLTPNQFIPQNDQPPADDNPIAIKPDAKFIDETNLSGGPIVVNGNIDVDYGNDGFGSLGPNGTFISGGSQTGGVLAHNGVPIDVNVVGNSYVGMAGGVTIFDLVIDPATGNYVFTQYENIDHADGLDPNDQISLTFGVTATDGDGDPVSTVIQIIIADDAPTISGASETIDETNLGPIVEMGTLVHNFGQDGQGSINATGTFAASGSVKDGVLSSGGVPITITPNANGYTGMAGGVLAFTLVIDPATGEYVYTQYKNLDHGNPNDPNDTITLTFGAQIVDYDGDVATAPIVINILDDAPEFQNHGPKPDSGYEIVDETNLGPVVETGTLNADFGSDLPGSYAFKDTSFVSSGSKLDGQLTHEGVPVVVTLEGGMYVGKAGTETIFTLELDTATGDYKFTLYDNFDHADATNPDDIITLDFGVYATDGDGDTVEGSIRIDVKDDAPIANNDVNTYDTTFGVANGNVITGLNGGPGAADHISTDDDKTPQQNSVSKIGFEGAFVDVPAVGTVSIDGAYGTLTIAADGTYTYQAFPGGGIVTPGGEKSFVGGTTLPDFDESEALDGVEQQSLGVAPGNLSVNAGDQISVTFHSEGAGYGNTLGVFTVDSTGKLKAETILIKNGNDAVAGQTYSYTAGADAQSTGFFLIADGAGQNGNYAGLNFDTGSLNFVYHYGQPDAREALASDDGSAVSLVFTSASNVETVLSGPLYFTTDRGGLDNLNADGSVRVVSGLPDESDPTVLRIGFEDLPRLGDHDYNDMVFDVSITTKDCGCHDPEIRDQFEYILIDGDGDTDPATLTLNGKDLTDDTPILVAPAAEIVDETNLTGGVLTETGNILVDYGTDGPGAITANGDFTSSGSKLNGQLTHMGTVVVVSIVGNTYVGKAGDLTVFTLKVNTNGSYEFKLFDNLDHQDGADANDIINLNFGITATDCDGDVATTHIVVKVVDDAPHANNDVNSYDTTDGIATGNVVTGLNGGPGAVDVLSTDANNNVTQIAFGGNVVDVPAVGTVSIDGAYGTLTIDHTGAYSYEAFATGGSGTSVEKHFVGGPALPDFDESEALDGVEQQSLGIVPGNLAVGVGDTISVKYVGETAGYSNTLGVFTVDASGNLRAEKILIKSSDEAVAGQTFNYTAGANAVATGFFLVANGANANAGYAGIDLDGGTLNFVYKFGTADARDAKITDDGSFVTLVHSKGGVDTVIQGETYFTSDRGGVETLNDDGIRVVSGLPDQGDDTVLRVGFEDLPGGGDRDFNDMIFDVSIIDKDCGCNDSNIKDVFTYTLTDYDGDKDTATLTLAGKDLTDSKPIITTPGVEIVDETDLTGGTLTETGQVHVNFGSDAPGTIEGNGSFTSSGSKLNGTLSSNGVAVVVSQTGNMYFGKANGVTIFTLKIENDGSYVFKQFDNLDHQDGNNPNDVIDLKFGVTATDCDGDCVDTTIVVKVKDDAPCANDDHNSLGKNGSANGNVITGLNGGAGAADVLSTDAPNTVSKIAFGATVVNVPTTGTAVINGTYGKLTIDATGAYTYVLFDSSKELDGKFKDQFTYTLKDFDGDSDPAKLLLDFESDCTPVSVDLCVNNGVDDICIKEDSSNNIVPLTASYAGGSGNEVMTLTLTGVESSWGFSASGWTNQGGGTWTITLPAGQHNYSGSFKFSPPANSDVDLDGLNVKASVFDPDNGKTVATNDGFNVNVDAVIDPLKFTAALTDHEWAQGSGKIFVLTKDNYVQNSKLTINNLLHADKDGSEALKEIVFTIQDKMDNSTYISVKNNDGTFSKIGVQGADGKDTTYTIDLSGMTYEQAENFIKTKLYLTNTGHSGLDGKYNLGIKLVSYEKNLSGDECDYTDNQTSYTICLPVLFCISPLVMDIDGDGVELLAQGSGVLFDMTNDGVRDDTGWADKDDALLALDKNGDGVINDRSELFGNNDLYGNGFDNLAAYDLNNDGVIDENDAVFKDLKAWQDSNSDGVSQEGELKSLSEVGIKAIKLNAAEVSYDIAGNPVTHESTIVRADGTETKVVDAWFAYESGAGVDKGLTLVGTDGNDVISGGSGSDDLFGGLGADTFLFQTITEGVDTLKDFNAAEGDKIDLSNVLTNYDAVTDAINDFVFANTDENGNTVLSVNVDGTGEGAAKAFAIIESANLNVSDLFNNGSLVA